MTKKEIIKLVGNPHKIQPLNDRGELLGFVPPYSNRRITFSYGKLVGFGKSRN